MNTRELVEEIISYMETARALRIAGDVALAKLTRGLKGGMLENQLVIARIASTEFKLRHPVGPAYWIEDFALSVELALMKEQRK